MEKKKITCECGFAFKAELEESDKYARCPECGIRILLEQVDATGTFFLADNVFRKTGFTSSVEGSLAVTLDTISFIGPAGEHPLSSRKKHQHGIMTARKQENKELDQFIEFRKGKRTLYEQIVESEDIETKLKQLAKYRKGSTHMPRKAIQKVHYDGGGKLVIITTKVKNTFKIPKQHRNKLRSVLRENRYT